jgi:hypothetical protein
MQYSKYAIVKLPYGFGVSTIAELRRLKSCPISVHRPAEYVAYTKVDKQSLPESFRGLELNDGESLIILTRDPANSKDIQVMRSVALRI